MRPRIFPVAKGMRDNDPSRRSTRTVGPADPPAQLGESMAKGSARIPITFCYHAWTDETFAPRLTLQIPPRSHQLALNNNVTIFISDANIDALRAALSPTEAEAKEVQRVAAEISRPGGD